MRRVISSTSRPLYPQERSRHPLDRRPGEPQSRFTLTGEDIIFLHLPVIAPRFFGRLAYNLVTTSLTLSRLTKVCYKDYIYGSEWLLLVTQNPLSDGIMWPPVSACLSPLSVVAITLYKQHLTRCRHNWARAAESQTPLDTGTVIISCNPVTHHRYSYSHHVQIWGPFI